MHCGVIKMLYETNNDDYDNKMTFFPLVKVQTRQRYLLLVKKMKLDMDLAAFLLERYLNTISMKL